MEKDEQELNSQQKKMIGVKYANLSAFNMCILICIVLCIHFGTFNNLPTKTIS